jgi:adenylate cyclase
MTKQRNIKILLFWMVSWIFITNLFVVIRFVGFNWAEKILPWSESEYIVIFAQASFAGIFIGLFFGFLDIQLNKYNAFHRISFGSLVLIKTSLSFVAAILGLALVFYFAAYYNFNSHNLAIERTKLFFSGSYFMVMMIYFYYNNLLLNFIRQVNDKFGRGNIINIFFGNYYKPIEQERIFIFIDLKSSTQYAEILGHENYSRLIQDCFYDITPVVYRTEGKIYQYVGDEIVLTWKAHPENFKNAVKLFYGYKKKIQKRADYYKEKYGFVPEFKAGLNSGKVMVAEVGVLKKEIAYHGDVLNTASRIQMECNVYQK